MHSNPRKLVPLKRFAALTSELYAINESADTNGRAQIGSNRVLGITLGWFAPSIQPTGEISRSKILRNPTNILDGFL